MDLNFEYIQSIDSIKEKHSHIICKFCNKPLVNPVLCNNCYDFICQNCPSTNTSNRCCETNIYSYLNKTDDGFSFNGKGSVSKILENLEIYCAVNKKNGCKWTGTRNEYLDHYIVCTRIYCECIYGCGQIINTNNIEHLDLCQAFNDWNNTQNENNEHDKKISLYMHYTKNKIQNMQDQMTNYKNNIQSMQDQIVKLSNKMTNFLDNKMENYDKRFFAIQKQIKDIENNNKIIKAIYQGDIIANFEQTEIVLSEIILPDNDAIWQINVYFTSTMILINKQNEKYSDAMDRNRRETSIFMCNKYNLSFSDFVNSDGNFDCHKAATHLIEKQIGENIPNWCRGNEPESMIMRRTKREELEKEYNKKFDKYIQVYGRARSNLEKRIDNRNSLIKTIQPNYDTPVEYCHNPTAYVIKKGQSIESRTIGIRFITEIPKNITDDFKNYNDKEIFFAKHNDCTAIIVAQQIG